MLLLTYNMFGPRGVPNNARSRMGRYVCDSGCCYCKRWAMTKSKIAIRSLLFTTLFPDPQWCADRRTNIVYKDYPNASELSCLMK